MIATYQFDGELAMRTYAVEAVTQIVKMANAVGEVMDLVDYLSPVYYALDRLYRDCLCSLTDYYGFTDDDITWEVHCPE